MHHLKNIIYEPVSDDSLRDFLEQSIDELERLIDPINMSAEEIGNINILKEEFENNLNFEN